MICCLYPEQRCSYPFFIIKYIIFVCFFPFFSPFWPIRKSASLRYDPPYVKKPIPKTFPGGSAGSNHSQDDVSLEGGKIPPYNNMPPYRYRMNITTNIWESSRIVLKTVEETAPQQVHSARLQTITDLKNVPKKRFLNLKNSIFPVSWIQETFPFNNFRETFLVTLRNRNLRWTSSWIVQINHWNFLQLVNNNIRGYVKHWIFNTSSTKFWNRCTKFFKHSPNKNNWKLSIINLLDWSSPFFAQFTHVFFSISVVFLFIFNWFHTLQKKSHFSKRISFPPFDLIGSTFALLIICHIYVFNFNIMMYLWYQISSMLIVSTILNISYQGRTWNE